MPDSPTAGRPRDHELDRAILDATLALLGESGYDALSIAGVAERAGTTRPAVDRRHPTKADLAVAALATLSSTTAPVPRGNHRADLERELTVFRDAIVGTRGVELAAAVLFRSTDARVIEEYRRSIVAPRRARIAAILASAWGDGRIAAPPDDQAVAVTMCTGSWYAHALAGIEPPHDWPERTARLVWRSVGGAS